MVGVIPKVKGVFDSLGQALPWYTQALIFVSDVVAGFWWLIFSLLGLGIWLFRRWKRTPKGKLRWDTFVLRAPLFGRLALLVAVAPLASSRSTISCR